MMSTLFITIGALLLAMIGSAALSPRSSREAEEAAEERARGRWKRSRTWASDQSSLVSGGVAHPTAA